MRLSNNVKNVNIMKVYYVCSYEKLTRLIKKINKKRVDFIKIPISGFDLKLNIFVLYLKG